MIDDELYDFFRKYKNVTQKELAKASKVNPSTVSRCRYNPFYNEKAATAEKIRKGMRKIERRLNGPSLLEILTVLLAINMGLIALLWLAIK